MPLKKKKLRGTLVCTSYSAGPVCESVASILKMNYSNNKHDHATVTWVSTHRELDAITSNTNKKQKPKYLSKLFGSRELCCKSTFGSLLNIQKQIHPNTVNFWPETFVLPKDRLSFEATIKLNKKNSKSTKSTKSTKRTTYILKPDDASQGDGIILFQKAKDLQNLNLNKGYVAQKYIESMLIDGYKFDLRIYVVVTSIIPLKAYVGLLFLDPNTDATILTCTNFYVLFFLSSSSLIVIFFTAIVVNN
jgi:hypothetical protein